MKQVVITGGMGFIGSHIVEHIHRNTNWNIVIIDCLSYASRGFERLKSMNIWGSPRIRVFTFDLKTAITQGMIQEIGAVSYIIHTAADTHVDDSIERPVSFILNNVQSTLTILEYARQIDVEMFIYFSTDEVFGPSTNDREYKEWDRHNPKNPYSASKSAAENICLAYENTYNIPIVIVNVMNAFGERQHIEKFIPKVIKQVLAGDTVHIHTDSEGNCGSRFYIHARNIADAILFLIQNATIGEKYNIRGDEEVDNLIMATLIADIMDMPLKYVFDSTSRPGNDMRYCLSGVKLREMGWKSPVRFEQSLERTVMWTLQHPEWLEW